MSDFFRKSKKARRAYVKDLADCDYVDQLSPEDQAWLSLFLDEYYDNYFKKERIHNDDQKKEIGQWNNERRRDSYAIKQCGGNLDFIEDRQDEEPGSDPEDILIELLDSPQYRRENTPDNPDESDSEAQPK